MPYDPIPTDADLAELVRQLHAKQHPNLITKNLFEMHRLAQGSPLASNPELRADLSDTLEAIVSTGTSLNTLEQMLMDAGAASVTKLACARTFLC